MSNISKGGDSLYAADVNPVPAHQALAGETVVACLGPEDPETGWLLDILGITHDLVQEGRKTEFYKAVKEARCTSQLTQEALGPDGRTSTQMDRQSRKAS